MTAKKTEITIETHETWIIRRTQPAPQAPQGWCSRCDAQATLLTPEDAARLTGSSLRQLFRQIEQAQIHFLETPEGNVWLCLPSLISEEVSDKL